MDISSKLGLYAKKQKPKQESPRDIIGEGPASTQLPFDELMTPEGPVYRKEYRVPIADLLPVETEDSISALLSHLKLSQVEPEELLFFDTETTSLSTGTGNYAFLCGIGYLDGSDFITEQLFLKSYDLERAMLTYMNDFFRRSKMIVVYNGKSFDIPLIKNRYRLNRVYGFPVSIEVCDLITPSRRVFKSLFEDCALQTLERNVLGVNRVDDIPGWMMPDIFFDYQKTGATGKLEGASLHNRFDIEHLYSLMTVLSRIFDSLEGRRFDEIERAPLGNLAPYLYKINAALFLDVVDYLGPSLLENESVFQKYSITLKRADEWEKAAEFWRKNGSLFSLCELAKYCEHKKNDPQQAIACCETALSLIEKNLYAPGREALETRRKDYYAEQFRKRKERLARKSENRADTCL